VLLGERWMRRDIGGEMARLPVNYKYCMRIMVAN
jgi:hypothetical protein